MHSALISVQYWSDDEKPLKIKAAIWLKFVSKWSASRQSYDLIIQNRPIRKCYIDIISQVMQDDPRGMGRLSQISLLSVSHVHIRDQNSHHSQHDFMANNYVWNPKANNQLWNLKKKMLVILVKYFIFTWKYFVPHSHIKHCITCFLTHLPLEKMAAILADDNFKCILLNENDRIPIQISLKFVPRSQIDNKPALVQVMAWRRRGDKPLPEQMLT